MHHLGVSAEYALVSMSGNVWEPDLSGGGVPSPLFQAEREMQPDLDFEYMAR